MTLSIEELSLRLCWAILLGVLVGLEREWTQKTAGLRTHTLVSLGSAVFTLVSISDLTAGLEFGNLPEGVQLNINRDPSRIMAQVVSGIGFIGGGALIKHGASIQGLTTAANLWLAASLGMMAGTGNYLLSFIAAVLTVMVLFPLGRLERSLFNKHQRQWNRLRLKITVDNPKTVPVQEWLDQFFNKEILRIKTYPTPEMELTVLTYILDVSKVKYNITEITKSVGQLDGVVGCSIRVFQDDGQSGH